LESLHVLDFCLGLLQFGPRPAQFGLSAGLLGLGVLLLVALPGEFLRELRQFGSEGLLVREKCLVFGPLLAVELLVPGGCVGEQLTRLFCLGVLFVDL
jgi:hypothetical protein